LSDHDADIADNLQPILRTVEITRAAAAVGHLLAELQLDAIDVQVQSIHRPTEGDIIPTPDTRLLEGDVVVLLGVPADLASAELKLLKGQ
jgi:CPA2 family monovalent cation:H+ antiporter-2